MSILKLLFSGNSNANQPQIGAAVQKGSRVFVYNERGMELFSKMGELVGHSGGSVSVRVGSRVYAYNARGVELFSKHSPQR